MASIEKEKRKSYVLLPVLIIGFLGAFAITGPQRYADSQQYIAMHIHREPLYPLFLAFFRVLCDDTWMIAVGIFQNVFIAVTIWLFAEYFGNKFSLNSKGEAVIVMVQLLPYIITAICSSKHLFLNSAILSEGISIPLFLLFFIACFEMLTAENRRDIIKGGIIAWGLGVLLSLARGQMMSMLLVWTVILWIKIFAQKVKNIVKIVYVFLVLVLIVSTFGLRSITIKTYNYAVHGYFINNTYGPVNLLTNVLYASDREAGEEIEDEETREWFYHMYDIADALGANYKFAGKTLFERASHIEMWHDTIKFEIIEKEIRAYTQKRTCNYIEQEQEADEIAKSIIAEIWPECIGQWIFNYISLSLCGLIRNIAIFHPIINFGVITLYVLAIAIFSVGIIGSYKKKRKVENEVCFMGLALLMICANDFAVSGVIMPLSRYMIYGFPLFYSGVWVLFLRNISKWKDKRKSNGQMVEEKHGL